MGPPKLATDEAHDARFAIPRMRAHILDLTCPLAHLDQGDLMHRSLPIDSGMPRNQQPTRIDNGMISAYVLILLTITNAVNTSISLR